ncbi:hypothetical protein [Oceanirhabdus seepicola]|uniref:Uncharacterized protein n=1 Tax=Oceanirhabdus seepicola TaxID=2828781 RepID=A0A9J6P3M1_9CLOT|nr:hypothetical protein [Oceanirhabdus seepicola]MCM1991139.1 hypothetical protein [Oceanirhabdus seepicola]
MDIKNKNKFLKPLMLLTIILLISTVSLYKSNDAQKKQLSDKNRKTLSSFIESISDLKDDLNVLLISNDEFFDKSTIEISSTIKQLQYLSHELAMKPKSMYNFSPSISLDPLNSFLEDAKIILRKDVLLPEDLDVIKKTIDYLDAVSIIYNDTIDSFDCGFWKIDFYDTHFHSKFFNSIFRYNCENNLESFSQESNSNNDLSKTFPNHNIVSKIILSLNKKYLSDGIKNTSNIFPKINGNSVVFSDENENCTVFYNEYCKDYIWFNLQFSYNKVTEEKKSEKELADKCKMYINNLNLNNYEETSTIFKKDIIYCRYQKKIGNVIDETKEICISLNEFGQLMYLRISNINNIYDDTPLVPKIKKEELLLRINDTYRDRISNISVVNTEKGIVHEVTIDGIEKKIRISDDDGKFLDSKWK